jgi:hypothetical protein
MQYISSARKSNSYTYLTFQLERMIGFDALLFVFQLLLPVDYLDEILPSGTNFASNGVHHQWYGGRPQFVVTPLILCYRLTVSWTKPTWKQMSTPISFITFATSHLGCLPASSTFMTNQAKIFARKEDPPFAFFIVCILLQASHKTRIRIRVFKRCTPRQTRAIGFHLDRIQAGGHAHTNGPRWNLRQR